MNWDLYIGAAAIGISLLTIVVFCGWALWSEQQERRTR